MADKQKLDTLYLDIAERVAEMSLAQRLKVGAIIVKNDNIVSMGWNGNPSGFDNCCEIQNPDGTLTTRPETIHAESNALMKLARSGGVGSLGATMYTSYSPCPECAKLIKQAGIDRVVYKHQYRLTGGLDMLKSLGVTVEHLESTN